MSSPKLFNFIIASFIASVALGKGSSSSGGSVHVGGYTRKDGTYVGPYERSAPNGTKSDNYSTRGNVNPYTGKPGTKSDDSTKGGGSSADVGSKANSSSGKPADSKTETSPSKAIDLSRVMIGMSKAQVIAALGEPNVKSEKAWYYMNAGWVRFKENAVVSLEAK